MYIRYVLMAALSLAVNLFVIVTSPLWAAWAAVGNLDRLPGLFSLLHTHDDDIYGHVPKPDTVLSRFKTAVWWLVRNPAYGFDAYVLGMPAGAAVKYAVAAGTFDTGRPAYLKMGWRHGGRDYFCYRRDVPLWGGRYIKLWFGWHSRPQGLEVQTHMLKIDFNPFKKAGD